MTQQNFEPKIVAFCCNWCSYAGADLAGTGRLKYSDNIRIIRVPCSSRVEVPLIMRAFQNGADGVMVAGCHPGDCHYNTGNYHTRRRMILLQNLVDFLGLSSERLLVKWISGNEAAKFKDTVDNFNETLKKLGPADKVRDLRCEK
ncbi:hydrogenase iron-sulfur subunit [Natranaerobius trueperi]|uniref:Methyl-viologen-reducing hydrogenase subunit delta n=1 Tax=Natranaerobius trueperi TaxID=759412 RepID=A0A226BZ88_9FIRM|nr:hydrogenase iron-sulfur subunit [Natranaerobius trueperi]OWZ84343.1 methyl-viologen-reducing hydrogenase subunit delta [Natranaerobius trueperi]